MMTSVMTPDGWRVLHLNAVYVHQLGRDDGRYRGEWVELDGSLVTPGFKEAVELIHGYRVGTVSKIDFINHPVWKGE